MKIGIEIIRNKVLEECIIMIKKQMISMTLYFCAIN